MYIEDKSPDIFCYNIKFKGKSLRMEFYELVGVFKKENLGEDCNGENLTKMSF